ncbi:LmeA family phospholipid-binding protein [Mycobacterium sp. LTG2003]
MPTPPQRPGQPGWRGQGRPPSDPATRRLPRAGRPQEPPTEQLRARYRPPDAATEKIARPHPRDAAATEKMSRARPPTTAPTGSRPRRRNRQTVLLIVVIAVSVVVGGLAAAELYARHRAGNLLVAVAECVVQDSASVSFGVNPPFLWQHITGHYTNISVETGGKRVQEAEGMTADVTLEDIRLQGTADSKGTIGSLNATLAWTAAGIKDTVAANLPGVGSLVTGVSTDPAAGTITLEAAGGTRVTAQPVVTGGDLGLQVLDVTGPFSKDAVQTALNELTTKLNDNYPLGIHADSVAVTDSGVVGKFSSQDAKIPNDDSEPCFERL